MRIGGSITIAAAAHSGKRPQTLKLHTLSSSAVPSGHQPAVVLKLPARVTTALSQHLKTSASVEFTVSNANGIGVASIRFSLAP